MGGKFAPGEGEGQKHIHHNISRSISAKQALAL